MILPRVRRRSASKWAEIDFTKQLRLVKSKINRQPDVVFNRCYVEREIGVAELTIRIFETCCHMLSSILSWRGLSSLSPTFPLGNW